MAKQQQAQNLPACSLLYDCFSVPVRKSKAADEKRRSLARQARDDYRRLSLQGAHRGKQADISKNATAGDRRPLQYPPLPPKPKLLPPAMANGRAVR